MQAFKARTLKKVARDCRIKETYLFLPYGRRQRLRIPVLCLGNCPLIAACTEIIELLWVYKLLLGIIIRHIA